MTENEISKIIVNTAYEIHVELGPGLLESVYEEIMYYELVKQGLHVERQKPIPVYWEDIKMDIGFRADLIVEIKSVGTLPQVSFKKLLTYLKIADKRLGLLINFNEALIKEGITRIANNL